MLLARRARGWQFVESSRDTGEVRTDRCARLCSVLEGGCVGVDVRRKGESDPVPAGTDGRIGEVWDAVGTETVGFGDERLLLGLR
jgi:hypothetical protein